MSEKETLKMAKSSQFNIEDLDETDRHLFDLTYQATKISNDHQYKGLANFLYQNERNNKEILDKLDDIKLLLKAMIK